MQNSEPDDRADAGWRGILVGPRGGLTLGLTLITLSVATESLVITAIMPAVVRDIGGVALYGVAFSAFFLAGLASIPIAGWAVDRYGPSLPFAVMISIFLVGTLIAALAPNMPVLVAARAAQGYGAAAQFTISQGTIARAYPPGARIRILSLMSASWILPGLLGPSLGAVITTLLGWRWAFGAILVPAIVAAVITYPRLRTVAASGAPASRPAIRLPIQLALGAGLFIGALNAQSWWSWPAVAVGLAIALDALRHVLPPGSMRANRGLPAIVASSFFLNLAFYSASSFVPLVLVGVRAVSVVGAGVAFATATLAWTVGVSLNTALVNRYPRDLLIASFATLLAAGTIAFATAIYGGPLLIAYVAWPVAGLGMGICFNTLTLNAMSAARIGGEGVALGARNLTGNLGTAVGTGLGGAAVAAGQAANFGLRPGLAATYALAAAAALTTAALAGRTTAESK